MHSEITPNSLKHQAGVLLLLHRYCCYYCSCCSTTTTTATATATTTATATATPTPTPAAATATAMLYCYCYCCCFFYYYDYYYPPLLRLVVTQNRSHFNCAQTLHVHGDSNN